MKEETGRHPHPLYPQRLSGNPDHYPAKTSIRSVFSSFFTSTELLWCFLEVAGYLATAIPNRETNSFPGGSSSTGLKVIKFFFLIIPPSDFKSGGGSHTVHVLRSKNPHPELPTQPFKIRSETPY